MEFLNPTAPDIMPDELEVLRKAGLRGRLIWQAGEPGMFGLPARVVLIARQPVTEEVRLAAPVEGSLIYLQRDVEWQRLGEAKLAERSLRIHPQSPWVTSVTLEMEDGGTMSGSAWVWERR
jgi:hypothetical protein